MTTSLAYSATEPYVVCKSVDESTFHPILLEPGQSLISGQTSVQQLTLSQMQAEMSGRAGGLLAQVGFPLYFEDFAATSSRNWSFDNINATGTQATQANGVQNVRGYGNAFVIRPYAVVYGERVLQTASFSVEGVTKIQLKVAFKSIGVLEYNDLFQISLLVDNVEVFVRNYSDDLVGELLDETVEVSGRVAVLKLTATLGNGAQEGIAINSIEVK